jgi:hypothetical protein
MTTQYNGRKNDLKNRINSHLKKLTGQDLDFYSKFKQDDLIELKTVLADINNVLTFRTTISATKWLCSLFKIDTKTQKEILKTIDQIKPNTKGYDIQISNPINILAEVKCISPVNNGRKFGSAQWNSILDDFHKLKNGKGVFTDTSKYYKFVFLLDLGERTDQAINQLLRTSRGTSDIPLRTKRHLIKAHISLLTGFEKADDLGFEKVYLKKIKLDK